MKTIDVLCSTGWEPGISGCTCAACSLIHSSVLAVPLPSDDWCRFFLARPVLNSDLSSIACSQTASLRLSFCRSAPLLRSPKRP